uniref:collagen alpha-1(I) chain-like n=1 Tax=Euleptes europaea TaxID=460621 RepID=UPI002540625C|nr:collagen alpha-1(I) chain-like [Euleptes europaea]
MAHLADDFPPRPTEETPGADAGTYRSRGTGRGGGEVAAAAAAPGRRAVRAVATGMLLLLPPPPPGLSAPAPKGSPRSKGAASPPSTSGGGGEEGRRRRGGRGVGGAPDGSGGGSSARLARAAASPGPRRADRSAARGSAGRGCRQNPDRTPGCPAAPSADGRLGPRAPSSAQPAPSKPGAFPDVPGELRVSPGRPRGRSPVWAAGVAAPHVHALDARGGLLSRGPSPLNAPPPPASSKTWKRRELREDGRGGGGRPRGVPAKPHPRGSPAPHMRWGGGRRAPPPPGRLLSPLPSAETGPDRPCGVFARGVGAAPSGEPEGALGDPIASSRLDAGIDRCLLRTGSGSPPGRRQPRATTFSKAPPCLR